jgi:hypothetical protein
MPLFCIPFHPPVWEANVRACESAKAQHQVFAFHRRLGKKTARDAGTASNTRLLLIKDVAIGVIEAGR